MKKLTSIILCILIITGCFSCLFTITGAAATSSQYNIIARANYLWNIVWYCKKDVAGWKNQTTFLAPKGYHLPYGQPIESGKYIGYGVGVNDFVAATKDPTSIFYTSQSLGDGNYSTYYALDSAAFVSWCWGTSLSTNSTIPNVSTLVGTATAENLSQLQVGDALNSTAVDHAVLVTGLTYCDGELATIQITEQTSPQMRRLHYTLAEVEELYSTNYSIYRYNGNVPPAPTSSIEPEATDPTEPTTNYFPACSSSQTILSNALNSIGVDYSYDYRKKIAAANGISNYSGTEAQNSQMLNLLKQGLLINPDATTTPSGPITDTELPAFSPPLGTFDTVTTDINSITVDGWAYDPDDPTALLDIHVYIGGDASSETAEHHIIKADQLREDIETVFGVGSYHGYTSTIKTELTGEQAIHIYAGNVGVGYDMHLGYANVNIPADTTGPVISDTQIVDLSDNSYQVSCKVKDESSSVTSVKFPTFHSSETIEDAVWYEGTIEDGIATATITVDGKGVYNTHIYAYDSKGNYSILELSNEIGVDKIAPVITDATISKVNKNGYTVSCNVTDNIAVTSVKFATFHSSQTIEQAIWQEIPVSNGVASEIVSITELGDFTGTYYTHIYAYDEEGNYSVEILSTKVGDDITPPVITDIQISDITTDSYRITCKITDDNDITKVTFLSYKISDTIASAKSVEGTIENSVATAVIPADSSGTYYVRVSAYDSYGNNAIVKTTVDINIDTTPPLIYDVKINNITNNSYTVSCNLADQSKISSVKFPSFHSSKTIDDAIWYEGVVTDSVATAVINLDELGNLNGTYYTHIYAYDAAGNYSVEEVSVEISHTDLTAPEITNAKISDISSTGYTVTCQVSDETGVTEVKFPSFHSSKTIDDAIWYQGTIEDGVATVTIPVEELGNLNGTYYTHIYAYDKYGNFSVEELSAEVIIDTPITDTTGPVISEISITNVTKTNYTVTCKVNDESGISSLKFLSVHSSLSPEQGVWYEGTVDENGIVTITIPVEELGNLKGVYNTYIHAYDSYDNHSVENVSVNINPELGDVTGDKDVNVLDVTAIQYYLADMITFDDNQLENADVNGDGIVSIRDATVIQLYLAKKITL